MSGHLDAFCGSKFWDYETIWNTTNPDFTECFQKTVLIWVPCSFLWIFAPFLVHFALQSRNSYIPWTILNLTKLVSAAILASLMLVDLAYNVYRYTQGESLPKVNYYAPLIQFVTFILATILLLLEKKKGTQSSGIIFIFWFLLMICGVVRYRSLLMLAFNLESNPEEFAFDLYMIYYPFVVALFVLSCLADSPPLFKDIDDDDDDANTCLEENSSFLSNLLFTWFDSMTWFGYHNPLERKNLWSLNRQHKSKYIVPWFEKNWLTEVRKNGGFKVPRESKARTKALFVVKEQEVDITPAKEPDTTFCQPSLAKALFKTFGANFLCGGFLKLISDILLFINPILLDQLIGFVSNGEPLWKGYLYAVLMLFVAMFQSLLLGQYFYKMFILGLQVRTALIASIYKKALVLSNSARKSSTVGEIVNLMSVDAQQIMDLAPYLHVTWSSPLQIALALYFLWKILGPSVLAGLAVMILLIPFSAIIAKILEKLQLKQMRTKDVRVKMMNELLNGIKVLKLYAWEPSFENQVLSIRAKELGYLKKGAYAIATTLFLWMCAPFMVALASFSTYILIDEHNILDASKAFVSLSIFQIISIPMSFLPMMVVFLIQASVSLGRLNAYLCHDEQKHDNITHDNCEADPIVVENGSFSWGLEEEATLAGINMRVKEGSLVAIVGPVGCGKSSLISALIGDMDKLCGKVNTKGLTAYVPQQAWIQNVTLKDNILFGKPFNNDLFNKCIEACALKADLDMLPGGELTEIGERGINLSGGQKQRVNLARSVYSNANIYLLDDPLSAVDAHVGRHIFDNVIGPNGILKRKTRVLVTHGITYLPQMDCIMVLSSGAISEVGTYKELLAKKGAFADFLLNYLQNENEQEEDVECLEKMKEEILANIGSPDVNQHLRRQTSVSRSHTFDDTSLGDGTSPRRFAHSLSLESSITRQTSKEDGFIKHASDDKAAAELITEETVKTGEVQLAVYLYYFNAVGVLLAVLILLFDVLSYALIVGSNLWLSAWSNDKPNADGTQDIALRDLRLGVYGGLGLAQAFFVFFAALILAFGSIRAGNLLHADMLSNIMRSPMSFFDTTPLGRIVNRFSKDVDVVDKSISETMHQFLLCALQVISTIVVISISTPIFIIVIIPLSIIYFFMQRLYIATSRQLKRLESTYRSPIYSHFSETVTGSSTIRAYGKQLDFISQSEGRVDENQVAYFPSIVANRWLAIRLEFLGSLIVFSAALFIVLARDTVSPGIVGLSLSYALSLTENLNWMVRMSGELETNIVAVERMKEYALTPIEKALKIEATKPPSGWPQKGNISFKNYALRYREGLELVLKGITFNIKAGEKIGIVGRTGAGKSSLTLALLRIIEPAAGNIIIDGIDIATIGLHDLRARLTIIPQDPVLFSGTLRINLDPFNQHTDEGIWKALELSHLKTFVASLPMGLLHEVSEGGENLSVGQRQLICLARALLRKSKILILDEATAAVDLETDDLIQATIRKEFADCTVLTIAHRLNTIMDSTKIVVLDKGLVKEFNSPENLLQDSSSVFFGMAKEAGLA